MPIHSIISQPGSFSINAAYRPVIVRVAAADTNGQIFPPVVYCDIYFNGIFYKTIAKTLYDKADTYDSEWQFDMQDAAQEYLQNIVTANGGTSILLHPEAFTECYCMLRSSVIDANGFLVPEGTAPVQGTGSNQPVAGSGGTNTNTFFILNCVLQHEDNQDLATHLNSYKSNTWQPLCYPLSHRPNIYIDIDKSDYFPLFISGLGNTPNDTDSLTNPIVALRYKYFGQTHFHLQTKQLAVNNLKGLLNIPAGTKNLSVLFGFSFQQVAEYYVELWNQDGLVVASSNLYLVKRCSNTVRMHFINYLGAVDAVNFQLLTNEHQSVSSSWERPEAYPLVKSQQAISRFNVTGNDTYTMECIDYSEKDIDWLDEIFDAPLAWMEWIGTQGQPDDLLPITIIDGKYQKFNSSQRYMYAVQIQFKFSHERKTIRN